MTIKELENRTGMTRANIRYYESEGLLSPERLANGYRDYSEEDARTLEKIRLLRQLQLDIDTIRKVQEGTLTLEQALFVQMTKLEGDRAVIERAAEVCRELERSGVEYGVLDPQPWLRQLEAPPAPLREALPPPPAEEEDVRDDEPRACYCPWQRWLARMLDMSLYRVVFDVLLLTALRDRNVVLATGVISWVLEALLLVFTLAVEPFWLHFWGWTPGKWVFGLKLRDEDGDKLTLAQGFRRGYAVFMDGYGMTLPFWGQWRMWQCRKLGLDGRDCPWDGEEDYRYTKEERRFSGRAFVGVTALCVAALLLGLRYSETPVNRGPLTVVQFAENYNYYLEQFIDRSISGPADLRRLYANGRWAKQPTNGGVVINVFGDTTVWDNPEFTLTDGYVTAVSLHMESEDWAVVSGTREQLALLALSGSAEGTDLFHYDLDGWNRACQERLTAWQDADFTYRGLHITQRVEHTGYMVVEGGLWWAHHMDDGGASPDAGQEYVDGDVPRHCEKTVTISLAEP